MLNTVRDDVDLSLDIPSMILTPDESIILTLALLGIAVCAEGIVTLTHGDVVQRFCVLSAAHQLALFHDVPLLHIVMLLIVNIRFLLFVFFFFDFFFFFLFGCFISINFKNRKEGASKGV